MLKIFRLHVQNNDMDLNTKLALSSDAITQKVADEIVVLDLAGESYFSLNDVGARVWMLLGDGLSLDNVVDMLQGAYDVERSVLERDVIELADSLVTQGLAHVEKG